LDLISDEELMKEVINLLAEEERWVQAITGLLTFGVMKYIVVPLLQDLNDFRKSYFNKPPTSPPQNHPGASSPPQNQPGPSSPPTTTPIDDCPVPPADNGVWQG
jgi:hypothetical protein